MATVDFVAAPSDIDRKELLQVAVSSVLLLGRELIDVFNVLSNAETIILSSGDTQDQNGCYTRIYLMKLETREAVAAVLFITFFSRRTIALNEADIRIESLKTALMNLSLNYREWVIMRVRYILVDLDDTKTLNSGSSSQSPDTIRISGNPAAHCIAEMVIHEASHLHYVTTVQSDAVTQKDAPEVYSIFMRRDRPLERVVFAYHAACNIACMIGQSPQHDHEVRALQDTLALGQTIAENQHFLTSYGRKLIEALP